MIKEVLEMFPTSASLQSSRLTFLSARLQYRGHDNHLKLLKNQPHHPLAYQTLGSLTSLLSVARFPTNRTAVAHRCFKTEESGWTPLIPHLSHLNLAAGTDGLSLDPGATTQSRGPGHRVPHVSERFLARTALVVRAPAS